MISPSQPDRSVQRDAGLTQFQIRRNRVNEQTTRILQRRRQRQSELHELLSSGTNNPSSEELENQRNNTESLLEHSNFFITELARIRTSLDNAMADVRLANNNAINSSQVEIDDSQNQCETQFCLLYQSVLNFREQLRILQHRVETSRPSRSINIFSDFSPEEEIEIPIAR